MKKINDFQVCERVDYADEVLQSKPDAYARVYWNIEPGSRRILAEYWPTIEEARKSVIDELNYGMKEGIDNASDTYDIVADGMIIERYGW